MAKNVVCKKCNNLINDWCEKVIDSPDQHIVRDCQYFREKTNADRIREMSDESVAAVLKTLCTAIIDCMGCPLYRFGCPGNNDLNDWIKWIQQPAEENKNGV